MEPPKWFLHPLVIFICSVAALGASLYLYIRWYLEASVDLRQVLNRFQIDANQVLAPQTWVVIMVMSLLVGVILMGFFSIFIYGQKALTLYRRQNSFINSFTHELKTPVTSLKLFLQTFSRHELPRDDQLRFIGFMINDVNRLSDNISRILDLARIENKNFLPEFIDADLVEALESFVQNQAHLVGDLNIRIHPPQGRMPLVRLNPSLFDMLVMNLVTNAKKYTDKSSPQLDIWFETSPRRLMLRFQDNGIGLNRSDLRKVFKKFYQVGQADDMSAKGSGLGLYLVRLIAQLHRWKVSAASEGVGQGTTISVSIPLPAGT